jgi:hypothetical protein
MLQEKESNHVASTTISEWADPLRDPPSVLPEGNIYSAEALTPNTIPNFSDRHIV